MRRFIAGLAAVAVAGVAGCSASASKLPVRQQSPTSTHGSAGSALPTTASQNGASAEASGIWTSPLRCPAISGVSAATGISELTVAGRNTTNAAGEAVCTYASANYSGTVSIWHPPVQAGAGGETIGQVRQALAQVEPVTDMPQYGSGAFLTGSGDVCWLYANFGDGKLISIQVELAGSGTTQEACADVRQTAQLLTQ
jgi:hypothetical protein